MVYGSMVVNPKRPSVELMTRDRRRRILLALPLGLSMALATSCLAGGVAPFPFVILLLNFPAFLGAALLSGNAHSPSTPLLVALAFMQWLLLGFLLASLLFRGAEAGAHARSNRAEDR
jgi:hypothetical protein